MIFASNIGKPCTLPLRPGHGGGVDGGAEDERAEPAQRVARHRRPGQGRHRHELSRLFAFLLFTFCFGFCRLGVGF